MGATLKQIDETIVLKLAKLGCTNGEIGDFFGVSDESIRVRFLDTLALGRANQKISLRRLQWRSAKLGNVPMQIHLGKQYLGQSDKQEFHGPGGTALFSTASQQAALLDPEVCELQNQIDERLGNPSIPYAGPLRDDGEP